MPTVRLTRAGAVETEVPLEQRDLRVGRASDNDVVLKDPDKTLSRHHAELRSDGARWFYLDLNSANGSWVGDRRVTREELAPGVSIALGDYQLALVEAVRAAAGMPDDLNATRVVRVRDTAVRPGSAAADTPVGSAAAAPSAVGGAVSVGAAPRAPAPAPGSSPTIRRIIIYGSIAVFGAFAVMLALLLRPDTNAPAEEPAAQAAAPAPALATPAPVAATPPAPPPPAAPVVGSTPPAATSQPAAPPAPPRTASATPRKTTPRVAPPRAEAPARPARDTDPDAAAIPPREGEAAPALQQRRDDIRRRYALAVQQLAARQFVAARELLTGVAGDAPRFRDLTARLAEADSGLRQQAAEGFKTAARLEAAAEWSEAVKEYERLRPYAAGLPGLTEAAERTRTRMHEAGAEALTRARQFDSRGRVPEAVAWYQRAVAWLPADHPGLDAARQRLAQLVNRP